MSKKKKSQKKILKPYEKHLKTIRNTKKVLNPKITQKKSLKTKKKH